MGFCFPEPTTKLPKFPAVLDKYLKRWHIAVLEDNAISCNQQHSLLSPLRLPGRYGPLEFGTHNFHNWLLSTMLDAGPGDGAHGGAVWDPGRRVYVGEGDMWSNDDARLLAVV